MGVSDPFAAQRLTGKVLVVTGSTQGLGAAIARRAVGVGAAGIVICGRERGRGEAVRDEPRGARLRGGLRRGRPRRGGALPRGRACLR